MNIKIELNRSDIASIIAEKYGVLLSHVVVTTEKECRGYGPTEHEETVPVARVTITRVKLEELKNG